MFNDAAAAVISTREVVQGIAKVDHEGCAAPRINERRLCQIWRADKVRPTDKLSTALGTTDQLSAQPNAPHTSAYQKADALWSWLRSRQAYNGLKSLVPHQRI
jgi:hypothetical protein